MCRILSVIPARGGSKTIPRKNICLLAGKPLIHYAINLAQAAQAKGLIADYLVSTDDKEIADVAREIGANVPFLRPKELAGDTSPIIDTLIHAVEYYEESTNNKVDVVCLLQPTNPLTIMKDLEGAILLYLDKTPASLISVCDAQHVRLSTLYFKKNDYLVQVFDGDAIKPRQFSEKVAWRNGAIYLASRELIRNRQAIDETPCFYEMPRQRSVPIDDLCDWELAELYLGVKNEI